MVGPAHAEDAPSANASPGPDKAAQIEKGKSLFISYGCGWCHEQGGRHAARCPQLMDDPHDDAFLLTRIATGSPGRMPAFGQALAEPDIAAIITYIRNLKPQ
jgi:mono/diheme cytochrome c family protein